MFLLDTNVVSELRRPAQAAPAVTEWAKVSLWPIFICRR
jgi:predicted nucleic acid-binding protein